MTGKKRRSKASIASTGKASSSSKKNSSTTALPSSTTTTTTTVPIRISSTILRHLLDIASSKKRSEDVLQTFYDGRCWTETKQVPARSSSSSSSSSTSTSATATAASSNSTEAGAAAAAAGVAFSASRSSNNNNNKKEQETNFDCYWIVLATNIMNRLLALDNNNNNKKTTVILNYLTALADAITTILLSDKGKIERSSHQATSRSILCRAILTSTMAVLYGIRNYDPHQKQKQQQKQQHETYEVAVATLDKLVHLRGSTTINGNSNNNNNSNIGSSSSSSSSSPKSNNNGGGGGKSGGGENNNETVNVNTDTRLTAGSWTVTMLEDECVQIDDLLESYINSENDCVNVLLEATTKVTGATAEEEDDDENENERVGETTNNKSPPAKRTARTRGGGTTKSSSKKRKTTTAATSSATSNSTDTSAVAGSSSSSSSNNPDKNLPIDPVPVVTAFEKLLASEDFGNRIDGRVAIKRWASIAVVWSQQGEGQLILLRETHQIATEIDVMTPIQKSRLMSTLISIISEAGNQCGVRPSTGGIDQYLKSITASSLSSSFSPSTTPRDEETGGSSGTTTNSNKKNKILRRADIRNWTTVVIYDYLQNHKECIQQTADENNEDGKQQNASIDNNINDNNKDNAPKGFSVPNFADLITNLCRSASSSSVPNSSYTQQSYWNKALLSIAAAFCLELVVDDPELPLDCKLISFALSHLVDCIRRVDPQSTIGNTSSADSSFTGGGGALGGMFSVSDQQQREFESKHLLRQQLPKPIVPSMTPSKRSSEDGDGKQDEMDYVSNECNFAGLSEDDSFTDEHAISLAIRAVQKSRVHQNPAAGKLLTFLTDVVRRTYDTRKPKVEKINDEGSTAKSSTGKRKRGTNNKGSSANRRGGRRRKTESGEVHVKDDQSLEWNRISSESASVATSALNALRLCLMNTKRMGACTIRQIIRSTTTVEHIIDLINLGEMLDKVLIKTRRTTTFLAESSTRDLSSVAPTNSDQDFTGFDKLLWSAHMNMCQVLGRGQLTYETNSGLDPVIWDTNKREAVYEAIAASNDSGRSGAVNKWSLSLPAAHNAFLAANLSCASNEEDKGPERYIVMGYVNSISDVLGSLETLTPKKWGSDGRLLDDEIPLSYNDSRIFILALNGLCHTEKRLFFDIIVKSALCALKSITENETKRSAVCQNTEASGFIARVVVICYSLVNNITAGNELQKAFLASMGCTQLYLPSFITRADWYRRDRTFMGIFDAWESPSLLESIPERRDIVIPNKSLGDFRLLLERAFSMGLEAAVHDHCHLLFTAWNGLDQVPEDIGSSGSKEQVPTLSVSMGDYSKKILQLREDVCSTYKAVGCGMPVNLKGMVSRASELAELLLKNHIPDDEEMKQEIPLPIMVLLAALPTYISACVAANTKPGNDYFSTTLSKSSTRKHKRRRGYSSESDPPLAESDSEDDNESADEVRIDAMSRLRECCDAFGAAPIHPDWLDVSCSLHDGIRPSDAIEVAEVAIKTLSRLATVAFTQYKKHQSCTLKEAVKDQKDIDKRAKRANLCTTLLGWSRHDNGQSQYPHVREWRDDVATVTKIPQEVIENLLDDVPDRDVEHAKACWCPYAGQRSPGLLQEESRLTGGWDISNAELRAGGEWELLLAEALTVSCLNTNQNQSEDDETQTKDPEDDSFSPEASSEMAKAQLWRIILMSATSHLVPAAALLRLGLGKVGRKPHPFAFHENNEDPYDVAPLHFSERLNNNGVVSYASSSSLSGTVHETLTMLARLSIEAEDSLSITCHAIASHLVIDSNTFLDLEGLYSVRCAFMGLKHIREIVGSSPKKDVKTVLPFLVERLVSIVEESGRGDNVISMIDTSGDSATKFRRLHYFLGGTAIHLVDTVTNKSIDIFKILETGQLNELCENQADSYNFSHNSCKKKAVAELICSLCEDPLRANGRTRSRIALMLSRVGIIESQSVINSSTAKNTVVVSAIIEAFNKVDKKNLKSVVLKDLCGLRGSKSPSETFRRDIASILCLLLFAQSDPKFERAKFIHDTLMTAFDSWKKMDTSHRELTLKVLLTYGSFFNSFLEIGSKLIDSSGKVVTDNESSGEAELLSNYFVSIKNLQSVLMKGDQILPRTCETNLERIPDLEVSSDFPKSCSFTQKSGFHGQHWYHCHTCNLVSDKGCCTLCALVCHRDHDVQYSRHSSFFCDCAAEDGNPSVEQSRVSCRCLSSLPLSQLRTIYENERLGMRFQSNKAVDEKCVNESENAELFEDSILVEIAKYSFADTALKSVNKFLRGLKDSNWLDSLFDVVGKEFKIWKADCGDPIHLLMKKSSEASFDSSPILRLSHDSFQKKLRKRNSKVLEWGRAQEKDFVSIRAATGFQAKFSSDSHDALTLARLSRNDISRSIMAIDSRGRMIVAEPSSLVFCSPIAAVNATIAKKSDEDEHISRHQMCIIGTAVLGFNVVGLCLCAENERHIVVWGTSEACVLVLKTDYSGVEDTINLTFEVDDQDGDGDVLVNCAWLPESQTHVAVGVSRFVRLFDVCRFEKSGDTKRAHPVIGYNLGFEACLRDLSIVPQKEDASNEGDGTGSLSHYRTEHISKMFLLLENGRLHSLDIKISNGKIESPSELHFEPSECVSIATEGIRPRPSSSIGLPGASTRTLGEGSKLVYLKQSRCLLYKCKSAAVVALMLGAEGNVEGTFELLPHTVSSTVLGSDDSDGHSISGPYTLWTELGIVYRKGTAHFRVACVGRSTRSGQSKLLCIEFNDKETKIKEITWSSTSSFGLGLHHGSFEGLAAFTAPIVQADTSFPDRYMTGERSFLCALSSGGNLLIFGEDIVDMMPTSIGTNGSFVPSYPLQLVTTSTVPSTPIRKFPLTLFEQLINVSESDSLLFSSDQESGIDSKELKSRLARDSSTSFTCPRREGCCLTISLVSNNKETIGRSKSATKPPELVISAIRVLIGSSSDCMPSKISVQGRAILISTPRLKRWYNIPLTEEEIARGVRTGFVSLWVGQSFDPTNSPVLDSVEVFASERKTVESFIPRNYFASNSTPDLEESSNPELKTHVLSSTENKSGLVLGVRAIWNLCELIGPTTRVSEKGKQLLQELVQDTAVHPEKQLGESVQMLCGGLDFDTRSTFQDENMLVGCSRSLDGCKALLIETTADKEDENKKSIVENKWKAIQWVLQDCLKVSSLIARERPSNYLQSMGSMENNTKSSIAIEASKLILEGLRNKSPCFEELIGGTRGIVFLLLTELALVDFFSLRESASTKDSMQLSSRNSLIKEFLDVANFSTCEAISTFFQDNGNQNKSYIPDLFVKMEAMKEVAYQCDSCEICPMKEVRYTILDEDYGIDLCKECYGVGKKFAANKKYNSAIEVVVNGKSVGGLNCAHMKEMEPVSLEKMEMDVEQVDVQEGSNDEDEELQKALKLSLGENLTDNDNSQDLSADHRGYEYFLGELFSFVMEQFSCAFKKERCDNSVESLIKLVLDLIRHSKRDYLKKERATWLVRDVSKGISDILGDQKLTHYKMSTLVTCLRALSTLSSPESESEFNFPGSKSDIPDASQVATKEQKNSKFVCNMHGIPAVRRRCDKGANKDRRFYVCGKEKGQRCDYFVWADEMQKEMEKIKSKSQFYEIVKTAMLDPTTSSGTALYDRLCILLEGELFGEDGDAYETSISLTSSTKEKKSEDLLKSFYSIQNMEIELNDGVFCSKEKISDVISGEALVNSEMSGTHELSKMMPVRGAGDRGAKLLEASLDLLTLIADHKSHGIARWFSILCEINMATNKHSSLRSLATNVLKLLCGGDRTKYHYVRDHYTFCFQLKRLYHFSYNMLEDALIVKEKTRQCSVNWKGPALEWSTLGTGDLIGTQDLISEDAVTEINYKCCGKALDEMWNVIKNRGQSWRQFCGYTKLPLTHRQSKNTFVDVAPIKALLWIACSTQGINQVKVLRLIDFALSDWKGRKLSNMTVGVFEEDGNNEKDTADYQVLGIGSAASKPEELLMMSGESKLGIHDVINLSLCMVRSGKTSELRRVAYHIVLKLSRVMPSDDQWFLFRNLLTAVEDIGMLGKGGAEFLNLLQMLAQHLKPNDFIGPMADIVVDSFIQQLDAIKYDRSNGEWTILETNTGSSAVRKRFDLSGCIFCLKPQHHSGSRESSSKSSDRRAPQTNSGRGSAHGGSLSVVAGRTGTGTTTGTRQQKWHSEQVALFSRGRLETVKESCTSNEFNLFYKLKYRIAISDIHLTISDPRGRYVKTISIYNTSRPLSSLNSMKSDQYSSKWEKIASLTLSRGATRASATLSQPIVSANLRLEFTDFYERPGDKDNREGTLHCPRCTRPVTNAHGVCVTCGEVAFQCRKCRHINYDRLDAFLCVECGYTCCGSFSFELNYAVATNAIAITDDKVLDKSIKMYGIASSIQEGLREKLGEKLRSLNRNKSNDEMEMDSFFDPVMQRAFLGLLPTDTGEDGGKYSPNSDVISSLEKQGSVVKYVAHPDTSLGGGNGRSTSTSDRSDRARSLLRLARQIRSESSSSSERRRSTDIIIRHLGRGISLENLEDENELLELLDSENSGTGNANTNDANNNNDQSESKDDDLQGNNSSSRKNEEKSRKAEAEECQKMLVLLREAGRESYELRRRIDAWKRLNAGALIDSSHLDMTKASGSFSFTPSHCSICGGTIAHQLLNLWMKLFLVAPTKVRVEGMFFNILFQEDVPNQGRGLQDLKKQVIVSIATNSQNGAEIVLRELRTRLTASHDMNCAEILGKIMEIEGFDMLNEYAKLAMDILSSRTNTVVGKM